MNHNVTRKTTAAAAEEDEEEVYDILEQGITQQQQQQQHCYSHGVAHSKQWHHASRFEAGDDDTEAPPIPKHHDNPPARAMRTTNEDDKEDNEVLEAPRFRKKSAPQLAPAMDSVTSPPDHVAAVATLSPLDPAPTTTTTMHNEPTSRTLPPLAPWCTTEQPGAIQVQGPGVHLFGRQRPAAQDQTSIMTPIAAEVVQMHHLSQRYLHPQMK